MNIMDYFKEISCIPRGSKNEKAISDYIVKFAKKHELKYVQDAMYNVVVYKDATPGYEDHPVLMLQGHIDMVCEKNENVEFSKGETEKILALGYYNNSYKECISFFAAVSVQRKNKQSRKKNDKNNTYD